MEKRFLALQAQYATLKAKIRNQANGSQLDAFEKSLNKFGEGIIGNSATTTTDTVAGADDTVTTAKKQSNTGDAGNGKKKLQTAKPYTTISDLQDFISKKFQRNVIISQSLKDQITQPVEYTK